MALEVGEVVVALKGDTKNLEQSLKQSSESLLALGASSVAVGNIATQAFNYLATGALNTAGAIQRWAAEAGKAAELTENLSMKTGISERSLEGWGVALARVGLDQEALSGVMRTLSKNMEGLSAGSEKSVELFAKLNTGMNATELAGVGTEQTLRIIADRFAGMANGTEKARLAQELLGRAGMQLIPVLNQGSAGLDAAAKDAEKFGLVLSETQRNALKNYDNSLDDLSSALLGFKTQVAAAFAPSLTRLVEGMTSAVSYAKTIFQGFSDAAEKLFIRFGALTAVIEIVGKQIFSLSVLNKQAWEQTIDQVKAIDAWAASEIKAVDAGKNAEVQMKASTQAAKEYTVAQKTLGEQIVEYTKIQNHLKELEGQHQKALGQGIVDTARTKAENARLQSVEVFSQAFTEEENRMKDAYAGSSTMIANSEAKLKGLKDMQDDMKKGADARTQAYIDEAMAADAALVEQTRLEVEADKKNQQYQGQYIVQQAIKAQQVTSVWSDAYGILQSSAGQAFGQIRFQFANTVVGLIQGTATWKDFWQSASGSILNAAIQMGINMVASFAVKNAAILAGELTTAGGVMAIWTATATAVTGAFGAMTAAIAGFFMETIIPAFISIGTAAMEFLTAVATAEAFTVFGIPLSVGTLAGVALIAAAIASIAAFSFGAFAKGGVITKPTMALMGEAGPEAVIPLNQLGRFMGGGPTTVQVQLDGRTIAKSVFDHMPSVMRVRGISA